MTVKVTVLGIGNQLMMDDGIGIYIVNELMKEKYLDLCYIIGESDIDYCIEVIYQTKKLVIIDAMMSEKAPCEISVFPLEDLTYNNTQVFSTHNLHFLNVMKHYKKKVEGFLIGIETEQVDFHYGLSLRLENEFFKILDKVKKELRSILIEMEGWEE
ncbi:hydrogenase maturation protease [Metabacillus halosaccharovorans]|uniref:hydrogenase maturation protease n=1 Tax=Metabacillus halosaccharovorans TaxID=930124 RepID=UPI003735448F